MIGIKKDFPLLAHQVHGVSISYLDNASTTQKPDSVIQAGVDFYARHNANVGRGIYRLAEDATRMYEDARAAVADFIGAKKE